MLESELDLSVEKNKTFSKGYRGDDLPYYLTGQEHHMMGSTPSIIKAPPEWYIPVAVISGDLSIEEASRIRGQIEFYRVSDIIAAMIGVRHTLALSLELLDLETGMTLQDPRVLGILPNNSAEIVKWNKDLTADYRNMCREFERPSDPNTLYHFR